MTFPLRLYFLVWEKGASHNGDCDDVCGIGAYFKANIKVCFWASGMLLWINFSVAITQYAIIGPLRWNLDLIKYQGTREIGSLC